MAKAFATDQDMARIEASVLYTERQPRRDSRPPGRQPQILHRPHREFVLAQELGPNSTADAYPLKYSGDGDTCTAADFEADEAAPMFKVAGGGMQAIRERTFAIGTRGHCRKDPGRKWWTIYQIDCEPEFF